MQFKYDILIQHSSIDNIAYENDNKGWVDNFVSFLTLILQRSLKREPRILTLSDNDKYGGSLIQDSAIFIMVVSPAFVLSDRFNNGVEGLEQYFNYNLNILRKNTFKVSKAPVSAEDLPFTIAYLQDFPFFEKDGQGAFEEYLAVSEFQDTMPYWMILNDLAFSLTESIEMLELVDSMDDFAGTNSKKPAVYLSYTEKELKEYERNIRRELLRHGLRVLPEVNLGAISEDLDSQISQLFEKSEIMIQLLGESKSDFGKQLGALEEKNAEKCHIDRIIWFNNDIELQTEDKTLLEDYRRSLKKLDHIESVETTIEDLKAVIKNRVKERFSEEDEKVEENNDISSVYLISSEKDGDTYQKLWQQFNASDMTVYSSEQGENLVEIRENHYKYLRKSDIFVVHFENGNKEWLFSNLKELKKAPGLHREKELNIHILTSDFADLEDELTTFEPYSVTLISADEGIEGIEKFVDSLKANV